MYYLYLLVMLISDLKALDYLLSMFDKMVDKDNPNMIVLDLKNKMLHPNRMDMVHLLVKNDLQMNFDRLLDQMMIIVIFLYYYYLLDRSHNHHQMLKKMDHKLLMMVKELLVNLANHRHYLLMMLLVVGLLLMMIQVLNVMGEMMNRMT